MTTEAEIWQLLNQVPDPEIPVISVVEIGMVRSVTWGTKGVEIVITPTYSGCPAMKSIEQDIKDLLRKNNIANYSVKTSLSPAWTTDWMSDATKEKLRSYGIAPPVGRTTDKGLLIGRPVSCPRCGTDHTVKISQFGSTPCKALYRCEQCHESFDYFKCV